MIVLKFICPDWVTKQLIGQKIVANLFGSYGMCTSNVKHNLGLKPLIQMRKSSDIALQTNKGTIVMERHFEKKID